MFKKTEDWFLLKIIFIKRFSFEDYHSNPFFLSKYRDNVKQFTPSLSGMVRFLFSATYSPPEMNALSPVCSASGATVVDKCVLLLLTARALCNNILCFDRA